MSTPSVACYARRYAEMGMGLTWTAPGSKGPRHRGWNRIENTLRTPEAAFSHFKVRPHLGVAAILEDSGLVSLDIDDVESSVVVLEHFGIDLALLRANSPCIVGRHFRLMYRAPEIPLKHCTLAWPHRHGPGGSVLFELRAGRISDTLPPTIHPGTGQPYRWENPPRGGFPAVPDLLLELWRDWPEFNRKAIALCPWATPKALSVPIRKVASSEPGEREPSVIAAFNLAHDLAQFLESHGYRPVGERFTAPGSHHEAGIALVDGGRLYCHHQGDPLSCGRVLDVFDVFRILEHRGDLRSAVRAASIQLGMNKSPAK